MQMHFVSTERVADLAADAQADALQQLQGVQGEEGMVREANEGADVQEVQMPEGLQVDQGALLQPPSRNQVQPVKPCQPYRRKNQMNKAMSYPDAKRAFAQTGKTLCKAFH